MVAPFRSPTSPHRTEIPLRAVASAILGLAVGVVVLAALYFGREIFVPLTLAILLSFALAPAVRWLQYCRVGRVPAVAVVVLLAFLAIFAFGGVVGGQVADFAESLPRYQRNIEAKIESLQVPGGGLLERVLGVLRKLGKKIDEPSGQAAGESGLPSAGTAVSEEDPLPVEIREPEPAPAELLQRVIGPLIEPLTTGGIVVVFVVFMLLQHTDLRDRFIRLAGPRDLHRTTVALDEAAQRVARYLLMQLAVNATYAIPVGIGLWLIGVPNPVLWGMLALVLRFVPFIGPVIAAVFPLALSIAVDPGWSMLLWTGALFIGLELLSNNIVEPWLYGSSTGLSAMAIIVAAIFWTWLWGPIGLLLSTPITVCLVVLGRHVPQLAFLHVLLGTESVLTPEERLYERLLAGDPAGATERAEELLEKKPLLEFYGEVGIPALALAEHDRARDAIDEERRAQVAENALIMVDNLSEHEDAAPSVDKEEISAAETAAPSIPRPPEPPPGRPDRPVLCAAGRGNLDEAAAAMLAQVLERHGIGTRVVPYETMQPATLSELNLEGVRFVCLSYMNADSMAHARYLIRRLRRRLPDAEILVGFWTIDPDDATRRDPLTATRADRVATSLKQAVDQVLAVTQAAVAAPAPLGVCTGADR